ncbi:MAG: hypothetical protein ACK5MY_17200 [Jhaorihella sp.]
MRGAEARGVIHDRLARTLGAGRLPEPASKRGAQLLARLGSPVSVVVIGPPGSGKSSIVNMLLGWSAIPETPDLPVLEIVAGARPRTVFELSDGSRDHAEGVTLAGPVPADVVLARVELPAPALNGMNLTEIRVAGSSCEQRAAVGLAVQRADIVLWCTQSFGTTEQALWAEVPDALKDHSFLVLTKADRLLMQGVLAERLAELEPVVAEEFYSLFPVATLQAIAARAPGAPENPALWKASGGRALTGAVMKRVETGRNADADSALQFLARFAAGDTGAAGASVPLPAGDAAAPPAAEKPAAPDRGGVLGRALDLLAARTGEMVASMPRGGGDVQGFVLDHCLATATELSEILGRAAPDDPATAALQADMAEGMDMLLLMQLEQTGEAAEDALTLLLQMKKELVECAAGARA